MQHTCLFYVDQEEALGAAARHLKEGLSRGERCVYVAVPGGAERARRALSAAGIPVRQREKRKDLRVLDARQVYLRQGRFNADATLALWRSAIESAGSEGRPGLRAAADMAWAYTWRVDDLLIPYESEVNRLAPLPANGLCLYPRDRLPAQTLQGTLCAHPWVEASGLRRENPYYIGPDEFRRGARTPSADEMLERLAALDRAFAFQAAKEREVLPILAHQFKTPLTAIHGFAESLLRHPNAKERIEFLQTIQRHAGRLAHLVDELLVLGRVGSSAGEPGPVGVRSLMSRAARDFEQIRRRKAIALEWGCAATLRARVRRGDVLQVLQSLLENALKVTPRGGRVGMSAVKAGGMVEFSVTDTGPGVSKQDLPHLFERFYRGRAGREADPLGTGLGLYIARRIVDAQGGRIWAESSGDGACFRFVLPAA
ncbi:MAG: MEDS domain-containing protein [Elusimicrobia bacterium]|nr:MEDS domain-containing protein [Elusimicrobiota bacterium]